MNHFVRLLALLLLPIVPVLAPAQGDSARTSTTVILSVGMERVFYPDFEGAKKKPRERFEEAVRRLKAENMDAFLIDGGYAFAPRALSETSYGLTPMVSFRRLNYDAVNLSATDLTFAATRESGMVGMIDPDWANLLVSNLGFLTTPSREVTPAPERTLTRKGRSILLRSRMSPGTVAAWQNAQAKLIEREPAQSQPEHPRLTITDIPADPAMRLGPGVVRLIAEFPNQNEPVDLGPVEPGTVTVLHFGPDGTATRHLDVRAFTNEEWPALRETPLPSIGVGVQNVEETFQRHFSVGKDNISQQVYDGSAFTDISDRQRVVVFEIEQGGVRSKVIRMRTNFGQAVPVPGVNRAVVDDTWPVVDLLVQFNDQGEMQRIVSRLTSVFDYTFNFDPLYDELIGSKPDEWRVEPERFPGAEQVVRQVVRDLGRTHELIGRIRSGRFPKGS